MSVLVTGGAGYIGSHMLLALLDAGEKALALDNLSTGHKGLVPNGATLIEGDVGDAATLARIFEEHEIEEVIHFRRIDPGAGIDPSSARLLCK